jgi:RNA polymerase sigma-70 factor (ECF subfamily)
LLNTNKIWEDFLEPLKRFVARRVENEFDVEDILQEIFYKIHTHIGCLKEEGKLRAWLFQIARNAVADHYRSHKPVSQISLTPEDTINETTEILDEDQEIIMCLRSMINYLPAKYRQAIVLSELEGLTQKELAEELGLSLSGAKSRVQRARKELKGLLTDCCQFEFDRLGNIIDYRHKRKSCPHCASD